MGNEEKNCTGEEIFQKISDLIIKRTHVQKEDIKMDSNFRSDFNLDSMDILDVTVAVERAFKVNLDNTEDMEKISNFETFTVGVLVAIVLKDKN